MTDTNGHAKIETTGPEATATTVSAQLQRLHEPLRQVIGTMIRGLLVSAPGIAPHVLLSAIAWECGNLVAGAVQGDLSTILQLRKSFKNSFDDGVAKAQITTPPMPRPEQMTSPPRR